MEGFVLDYASTAPGWGWQAPLGWVIIFGFACAYFVGFGMGANDCANAYGTVVGSGVMKLWQVYLAAGLMNLLGGVFLGYKVTTQISHLIVNPGVYNVSVASFDSGGPTCADVSERGNFSLLYPLTTTPPSHGCPADAALNYSFHNFRTEYSYGCPNMNGTAGPDFTCRDYTHGDFVVGMLAVTIGTSAWLLIATALRMPVSTTHSIVGGTVGMSLMLRGVSGINWLKVGMTVASWVISPLLSGLIGASIYMVCKWTIFMREDPFESSFAIIPCLFAFVIFVNTFAITYQGSQFLRFNLLSIWQSLCISFAFAILTGLVVAVVGNPRIRRQALKLHENELKEEEEEESEGRQGCTAKVLNHFDHDPKKFRHLSAGVGPVALGVSSGDELFRVPLGDVGKEDALRLNWRQQHRSRATSGWRGLLSPVSIEPRTVKVFHTLQVLSACLLSFAHGTNDTANAVGPLAAMVIPYEFGNALINPTLDWRLFAIIVFGDFAIACGLWSFGHKVIKTVGKDMTDIIAPVGFCMELGAAFTVVFGSHLHIPLSTTHCAVGSIIIVGLAHSAQWKGISWSLMGRVAVAWVVTLPVAGGIAAAIAYALAKGFLGSTSCITC